MSHKSIAIGLVVAAAVVAIPLLVKSVQAPAAVSDPASVAGGKPKFLDLGTTTCAPCKAMLKVMDELRQTYPTALTVEFVNVNEQRDAMARFQTQVIPTQIFFSPDGKELFRHVGVIRADAVASKWAELGFPLAEAGK